MKSRTLLFVPLSWVMACGSDGTGPITDGESATGTQGGSESATGTGPATSTVNPSSPTEPTSNGPNGTGTGSDPTADPTTVTDSTATGTTTTATTSGSSTDASTGSSGAASASEGTTAAGTTTDTSSASTGGDTGEDPIVSVEIEPLDVVVEVLNGVIPPSIDYKAIATTQANNKYEIDGTWTWTRPDAAAVAGNTGILKASGIIGAKGTIGFVSGNLAAETSATIKLHDTAEPAPIDPTLKKDFSGPAPLDPNLVLLYPYNQTVFPRGLTGPTIQWNGGAIADIYYIQVLSPTYEFEFWGAVPPKSRYNFPKLPVDVWAKLTASNDADLTVDIKRFNGNQIYAAKTQTWTIAPASLAGIVYYWEVNNGKVVRLPPGASKPEKFLEEKQNGCIACHSVSADGSTLAASYAGGWSPWATWNAQDGKQKYYSNTASGFTALSPNGSHVVWGHWSDGGFNTTGALTLSVFNSIVPLAKLDPPPVGVGGGAPAHPAWSTDGNKVAFSVRTNGNGLDFTASTLWVTDVDLMMPKFFNTKKIVDATVGRPTTTFPTFSPDSKQIAFERATQARTRGAAGELFITDPDGESVATLDNANGKGIISAPQAATSYEPTFMPVSVGGYNWLVFGSERMYGNTLEDQNVNTRKKQLWVAAIDIAAKPGQDPSHPAFWLPGQELGNNNMRGSWSLSPCKNAGQGCGGGFDCCGGYCYGAPAVCQEQPLDNCAHIGDKCSNDGDCCAIDGSSCLGGFCSVVPN